LKAQTKMHMCGTCAKKYIFLPKEKPAGMRTHTKYSFTSKSTFFAKKRCGHADTPKKVAFHQNIHFSWKNKPAGMLTAQKRKFSRKNAPAGMRTHQNKFFQISEQVSVHFCAEIGAKMLYLLIYFSPIRNELN